MAYSAEISRANPSCFLFMIDRSGSMNGPFGDDSHKTKAEGVADKINSLLQNLALRCAKSEGVRDYFHVGVIGYGGIVGTAFNGQLAGRELIPLSEVADNPARIEDRVRKVEDGAGGLVEEEISFPIWFEPVGVNGTPMCKAFNLAHSIIQKWLDEHGDCFPPTVINITDGASTDGNPAGSAESLKQLSSSDGNVLLFNLHISSHQACPVVFPDNADGINDPLAVMLFKMSSVLPEAFRKMAGADGFTVSENTRGFAFNADLVALYRFLDIGTRVPIADLRDDVE